MEELLWKEEYNVGCDYVDKAHQKLFSVFRRVERLLGEDDYEKNRFACIEAVKFLYSYTASHFAQEEAYMRETGYEGYDMHKKLHDDMSLVTLPALDKVLVESDYSEESMREFIAFFAGWLTGHILIEDRAITGRVKSHWEFASDEESDALLDERVRKLMTEIADFEISLITTRYDGTPVENSFCYEMNYPDSKVVFIAQKDIILKLAGRILGTEPKQLDRTVMLTFVQFAQSAAKQVLAMLRPDEAPELRSHRAIAEDAMKEYYKEGYSGHSLKWKTTCGYMALCVL